MSRPYEFVATAQTSFAATASTPRMFVPGTNVASVQLDPFQCSAMDCQMIWYGVSMRRAPTDEEEHQEATERLQGQADRRQVARLDGGSLAGQGVATSSCYRSGCVA